MADELAELENHEYLFKLAQQNRWDNLITYLAKYKDNIDVNLRDGSDNYLINYAITQNQANAVLALLDAGSKIDMVDLDGRSLLYVPLKFGYLELIQILLNKNKNTVGISIVDLKDNTHAIPLHYAINFKNLDAIKLLLNNNSDVNATDDKGHSALHLAIYSRSLEIVILVCSKPVNINARTKTGETALHIAANFQLEQIIKFLLSRRISIDIQDYEHEFTALHYAVNLNNTKISAMLIEAGANINAQDFLGNTVLHYSIIEDNYEVYTLLVTSKETKDIINMNLYNIDSKLAIHIMLEKDDQIIEQYLELILEGSNLNFADTSGATAFYLLVQRNIWKRYKEILAKKKLNMFAEDSNKIRPIDLVKPRDLEEFINLITDSYLYVLRNNNSTWGEAWENMCNHEILANKITAEDAKLVRQFIKIREKDNQDLCIKIIQKKLLDDLKKDRATCSTVSYPRKKNQPCVKLAESKRVEFCTFMGFALDILIGLVYLLQKHENTCSTLSTQFMNNPELCDYYKKVGIVTNTKCEFLNFEVVWVYQKLYVSTEFERNFKKLQKSENKRFIIVPLGIEMRTGNHANYLIYDIKTKEMERFEPYGSSPPYKFDYNANLLDTALRRVLEGIDKNIKLISPKDYEPKIGFQYFDTLENRTQKLGDPNGFCALWSIWYVDYRVTYEDIPRNKLVKQMLNIIKVKNSVFKNTIRDYSKDITDMRDQVLIQAGLNINNWMNDQYGEEQVKIITVGIAEMISLIE